MAIFGVFQEMAKNGVFWQILQNVQNDQNGIFQEFPKIAKIGYFPKNGVFQEIGYFRIFASVGEKWENGCFCVFWKNGGSVKKVILTDLVKNVKNGVFLTKCQKSRN